MTYVWPQAPARRQRSLTSRKRPTAFMCYHWGNRDNENYRTVTTIDKTKKRGNGVLPNTVTTVYFTVTTILRVTNPCYHCYHLLQQVLPPCYHRPQDPI